MAFRCTALRTDWTQTGQGPRFDVFVGDRLPQPAKPRQIERRHMNAPRVTHAARQAQRPLRRAGWGLVDQIFSSLSNLGLTLIAARMGGASELGVVAISFTAYVVALGLQRALISDPLVVATAALSPSETRTRTREVLPSVLAGEALVAITIGAVGVALPGVGGRALLIIAVWIMPTLFQDFCRAVLFRDRRGRAAAATDCVWVIVMAIATPIAWWWATDWAAIGAWGLGGTRRSDTWVRCTRFSADAA